MDERKVKTQIMSKHFRDLRSIDNKDGILMNMYDGNIVCFFFL